MMEKPVVVCYFISNYIERPSVMGMFEELFLPLLPGGCTTVVEFHREENVFVFSCLSGVIFISYSYIKP